MQINYFGQSCFKLRFPKASVLTDPFEAREVGFSMPKVTTDIVTVSHEHNDHSDLSRVPAEAFVIDAPGEYEVKEVYISTFPSFHDKEKKVKNNIFLIEAEGMRICHLGDLGVKLSEVEIEQLGSIDVLLTPVGEKGGNILSTDEIVKLINQIDPSIVIPMHYKVSSMPEKWTKLATLDDFFEVYGSEGERQEKLVLSKVGLPEETKLVILQAKAS